MEILYILLIVISIIMIFILCLYAFSKKSKLKNNDKVNNNSDYMNTTVELNDDKCFNSTAELSVSNFEIVEDITFSASDKIIEI